MFQNRSFLPRCRLAVILLPLALGLAAGTRAAPVNLLQNPGFEEPLRGHPWMPTGWDTSRAGLPSVFFGRDTFLAHGGSYSASVANASTYFPMAHNWSQLVPLGPEAWGKDLVLSIWTRSNGVEGRAFVKLEAYRDTMSKMSRIWGVDRSEAGERLRIAPINDPIVELGWHRAFFSEYETDWVRRELRVHVAPSTNVAFVRGGIMGTGQLMLDDAALTLEPPASARRFPENANLLADPGFEGDGMAWERTTPPYPDIRFDRDTTMQRFGRACLRITTPPSAMISGPTGVGQVFSDRGLAGKRVRFTGYIKTDSLLSNAFLKVYCHTVRGVEQFGSQTGASGTMDWEQYEAVAEIPEDTYSVWAWMMYMAPTPGVVYFDEASLVVLGPSKPR